MNDTQWPRFEVFVQEKTGGPYLDAGSVHAPDAEMALLNARDVFARRPEAVSMWIAPAAAIYSKTDEELRLGGLALPSPSVETGSLQGYHVFCKAKAVGTQTLIGRVEAAAPVEALAAALAAFGDNFPADRPPFAWWVIPVLAITAADPADREAFYTPALDKPFRLSTDFKTHTAMRTIQGSENRNG